MRKPFVAGNWKMHKAIDEAVSLVVDLRKQVEGTEACDIAVFPPFTALFPVRVALEGSAVELGAQDIHWEREGAFTGEISATMLAPLCKHVIVGHSERRTLFGETDETVNLKLVSALAGGLLPILCVGENLEQNRAGQTEDFVGAQVRAAFADIPPDKAVRVTIAYEPIWAIGTGVPATGEEANRIIGQTIRSTITRLYGTRVSETIRLQYGGSVKPSNAREFLRQPEIDGALVGGASLNPMDFAAIVRAAL
jgi:triosephosphate isomerase